MKTPLILALLTLSLHAQQGNVSPTQKHAWSANTGWLHFLPGHSQGLLATETYLARYVWSANLGWINLGDGSPANGHTYSNTTGTDSGVNLLPNGDLQGLAWSANAGWLDFGAATGSHRARIDLLTGEFHGYAYGANIGWINLGNGNLSLDSLHCPDADSDGLADSWEMAHFGNLNQTANNDPDGDNATNALEYLASTDPNSPASSPPCPLLETLTSPTPALPDYWNISFASLPGRIYQLQRSTNLIDWLPHGNPQTPASPTTLNFHAADLNNPNTRYFFRIVINKPLQN